MYDDYDFDLSYDNSFNLDEDYADRLELDENDDYARESTDFQELAYLHYAWCISTRLQLQGIRLRDPIMEGKWGLISSTRMN